MLADKQGEGGLAFLILLLAAIVFIVLLIRWRRRAKRAGHAGIHAYLRSAPRTDAEKRDAVDLAMRGSVICLLAAIVPPLLVVGVIPLYYGARKLFLVWMGLEIIEEGDAARSESNGERPPAEPTI